MNEFFQERVAHDPRTIVKEHKGLAYCVCMANFSINGYVELPDGHPWLKCEDEWDVPADVHGGITYFNGNVIGFDTNHLGDSLHPLSKMCIGGGVPSFVSFGSSGHVWDWGEVEQETLRLVEQAVEAGEAVEPE